MKYNCLALPIEMARASTFAARPSQS